MATSFPEIGVQAVLQNFYYFQRDINTFNRTVNQSISSVLGATTQLTRAQTLANAAAQAQAVADLEVWVAEQKLAESEAAHAVALDAVTKATQRTSAARREAAVAATQEAEAANLAAEAAARNAEVAVVRADQTGQAAGAAASQEAAAGTTAAVLGLAAATALATVAAVRMGAEYQQAMSQVATALQVSTQSTTQLKAVNDQLSASYGQTVVQSGQAEAAIAKDLSTQNKNIDTLKAATEAATELSKATGSDLPSSIKLTTAAINSFNLNAGQARNVADAWTVALNSSNLDARTAYASFTALSEAMKAMGADFNTTVALEAAVAQGGDALSRAGLDMSRVITSLVNPSKQATDAMNQYKISTQSIPAFLQSLDAAFGSQAEAEGRVTQATRDLALAQITGQSGVRVLGSDLDQLTKNFDLNRAAMDQTGLAQRAAMANTDNLSGSLNREKSTLEDVLTTIGAGLAGPLNQFLQWQMEFVNNTRIQSNAAKQYSDDVNRLGMSTDDAAKQTAAYIVQQKLAAGEFTHLMQTSEDAAAAMNNEVGVANNLAAAHVNAANAAREQASAERELAAALGSAAAQEITDQASVAAAQTRAAAPGGTGAAARIAQAKAELDAQKQLADGYVAAKQTQIEIDTAQKLNATQNAQARATISAAASAQEAAAQQHADAMKAEADANYQRQVNQDEARAAGGGGGADGGAARAAEASAQSQIESTDKVRDTFLRDLDQMQRTADTDFKKMAASYAQNVVQVTERLTQQLADDQNRIAEAQAAEQTRIEHQAEQDQLQQQIQEQRDAFDDQKQRAQDAFDFQERLIKDQLADRQQAERDAFDLQQEALDKGVDSATVAATQQTMATAEANQLKNTNLTAAQRAQIQSDYATNQTLYAQQVAAAQQQIQKDAQKKAAQEQFDAQLRAESEAADDASLQRREALDANFRTQQEQFDQQVASEQLALENKFAQEALAQQISNIKTQERQQADAATREVNDLKAKYDIAVQDRKDQLAKDLANLVEHFAQEMQQYEAHWAELLRKTIANDAKIQDVETSLSRAEVDNANVMIRAFNNAAKARAGALGIGAPADVPEIPFVTPATIPTAHDGSVIGGLPGSERLIRALAGEMVIQPASLGLPPSNNYNANTVNNNYAFHANYSAAQQPNELRHDIMAIMALTRGGR